MRTVGALDGQLAQQAIVDGIGQRGCGRVQFRGILGEREQCLAAAFDVEDQRPADQDHQGARLPAGSVPFPLRPGQRGTVRIRWIAGGQDECHGILRLPRVGAQPVDRTSERELGSPEPFDEVAATALA